MKTLTVVIPALNEEHGIGQVLREVPVARLKKMGYRVELMVIDNGSTDQTWRIAKDHGAKIIIQPIRGYGNAYKAGFANASGDIIATGDADLTYPFIDLPKILKKMEKDELDFVNTNRLKHIDTKVMSPSHIFGNWLLTTISKLLYQSPFEDSQSGMWIFKRSIWKKLNVRSSGMAFSQEIKLEAHLRGFKCAEVLIKYRTRAGKEKLNTVSDGIKTMSHLLIKRLSMIPNQIQMPAPRLGRKYSLPFGKTQ